MGASNPVSAATLPQKYEIATVSVLADVENLSDWSASRSDTAENTQFYLRGNKSIEMQTQSPYLNSQIQRDISVPVDESTIISLSVYIPQETYDAGYASTSLQIFLYDSTLANYWRIPVAISGNANVAALNAGWNTLVTDLSLAKLDGTTPSYANGIGRVIVRVQDSASIVNQKVIVDDLLIYGRARPKLAITFDDNMIEQFDVAYDYMQPRGIVGSCYINSNTVGSNSNYMTTANLKTLQSAGWDILNHAADHTNLTTISLSSALSLVSDTEKYLSANGFTTGSKHFAYPFGGQNIELDDSIIAAGYKSLRTTKNGQYSPLGVNDNYNQLREINLGNATGSVTTLQDVKDYIDETIRRGATGCILGHKFLTTPGNSSSEWAIADFYAMIDYIEEKINQGLIDVVNIRSLIDGMRV